MKRLVYPFSLAILLFLILTFFPRTTQAGRTLEGAKPGGSTPTPSGNKTGPIKQAILDAVKTNQVMSPVYQIYTQSVESVSLSSDGEWARAWLVSIDPQTGEPAACEPGLVLAQWEENAWKVILPSDPGWAEAVKVAPLNLLPQDAKDFQLGMMTKAQTEMPTSAFTGYYLPWQAGMTKHLSQSTYHDYYTPSGTAHYAFDFYVHETIWDILASKPGIVWKYYDAVPTCYDVNCGQDLGNYIVVKDPTTNPVSYMLYLHLAQNSIPSELKHVGALVKQAQFIGKADNTGASWGDHLHFMVHTNPNSYWGQSVDIRFSDVPINGGRPRVAADKAYCNWPGDVCTSTSTDYISFNTPVKDNTTPSTGLSSPGNGDIIAARSVTINGWGSDSQAGIFSLQAFVNYTGSWVGVDTVYFTSSLGFVWDWCNDHVPNGPVSLGIQATDLAGHVSAITSVRTISKSFSCSVTSAGVDLPLPETVVNSRQVTVSGWGVGETGLLSLQAMANIDGSWQNIGASSTSPLTFQWDLCNAGVPNEPISIAFKTTDLSGATSPISDVHTFIKDYDCPAPTPVADQVLICTEPAYGNCYSFGAGQYTSGDANHPMDPLPEDSAYSVRVGSNVQVTLFGTKHFSGRGLTFFADDPNLADDIVRQETMRSFIIQNRSALPSTPKLPTTSASYQAGDVVTLYWENSGGAVDFQVQVTGTITTTTSWQTLPYLHWTGLDAGSYSWKVRGRNPNGTSAWSLPGTITISSTKTPSSGPMNAPYGDDMENSSALWTTSGLWRLGSTITATTPAHSGSHAWWYQNQATGFYDTAPLPNAGDLTSPEISIPASGYSLRFWYIYGTETAYPFFEQRWLQISQDGGPFTNTLQLSFDPMDTWLQSPYIDLSKYVGHNIRVRFHFETLDDRFNAFSGWGVDDFAITQSTPPGCTDTNEPNDGMGKATPISYGSTLTGQICPPGDVDFFAFTGAAGDVIGANIDAQSIGSKLDSVLYLLDANGNLLTWNDDKIPHELLDSQLYYRLPATGKYYLKVLAWDHPEAGSSDDFYHLTLYKDSQKPLITMQFPATGGVIPGSAFKVKANVSDNFSGVSHVDFMWHSNDWVNGVWNTLGSDWDGSDGWGVDFDGSSMVGQTGLAFYAQAFDKAGNSMGVASWNVSVIDDSFPPSLSVQALPTSVTSTAIRLQWTASDTQSGIDYFAVQVMVDSGAWSDYQTDVPADTRSLFYVGQQGHSYAFRMQAVDRAGNLRPYPASPEVTTSIPANVCQTVDVYEPDQVNATSIQTNWTSQFHNFCNPISGSSGLADQDWVTFTPEPGQRYFILALPQDPATGVKLTLYASDKTTVLSQASTDTFGSATAIRWVAASADPVYLKMEHINPAAAGSSVSYKIYVSKNYPLFFFPVVNR